MAIKLRAYPNNPLYPQGKPDACVVGQKRSQHGENHASEHFWPAALASNSAIGGQVLARPHSDLVIRISSKFEIQINKIPNGGCCWMGDFVSKICI